MWQLRQLLPKPAVAPPFCETERPGHPVVVIPSGKETFIKTMSSRAIRQFLQMMISSGVSHLPTVILPKPSPRPKIPTKRSPAPTALANSSASTLPAPKQLDRQSVVAPPVSELVQGLLESSFQSREQKTEGLLKLAEVVSGCQNCPELAAGRTQTVFGVGNPAAKIMFVGEAPGADEDRKGEPFVGPAGQLLDKIIAACALQRSEIYICNILRCRPPGNRNPLPQEAANCRQFLDGQIKIVNPEYIVCWGTVAAQNLLGEQRPVGQLRGKFLAYGNAKVLCTYHPSYLLRNPSAKKLAWEDMQLFMKEVNSGS